MMLHRMNAPELPAEYGVMTFDRWTGGYRDTYNDIFLIKRHGRKQWELASREAGNQTKLWSRHRDLECGLIAANKLHGKKRAA